MIGIVYTLSEGFTDLYWFPKKLLESSRPSSNYKRKSLHAFIAWVHFTFVVEEALESDSNSTHSDPIFYSTIPDRNAARRMKRISMIHVNEVPSD